MDTEKVFLALNQQHIDFDRTSIKRLGVKFIFLPANCTEKTNCELQIVKTNILETPKVTRIAVIVSYLLRSTDRSTHFACFCQISVTTVELVFGE